MPSSKNRIDLKKKLKDKLVYLREFIIYGLSSIAFITGQIFFITQQRTTGLLISLIGAGFGLGYYLLYGIRIYSPKKLHVKSSIKIKPSLLRENTKSVIANDSPKMRVVFGRGIFLIISFVIAFIAQGIIAQQGNPQTLDKGVILYIISAALFLWVFKPWFRENLKNLSLNPKIESIVFTFIILIAIFYRFYKLNKIPSGLFIDQGYAGYSALKILHQGWRPFYITGLLHAFSLAYYQLALWFTIFKPNQFGIYSFYATLSILAFPLIYWTFRQLAGARVALLSIFILAVMRWNVNFSRNGFPTIQVPLYMFGTLAFLLYGLNKNKRWAFIIASIFFSAGFYTYQAYQVFPLLLLFYSIYELINNRRQIQKNLINIFIFTGLGLILTFPVYHRLLSTQNLGSRESQLFIMNKVKAEHSWKPFWRVVGKTELMFNREGDSNPRQNLQNAPMLDTISGILFVLGLFYALSRIIRRKYFYAISGFLVTTLPCVLTIDPAHANRMLGITPFLAFIIAIPLSVIWGRIYEIGKHKWEKYFLAIMILPLGLISYKNFYIYFYQQANNYASWANYSIHPTAMGKFIQSHGRKYDYYISPIYFHHYTIDYFGYKELSQIHRLTLPNSLAPLKTPIGKGAAYCLPNDQKSVLKMLLKLYPHGEAVTYLDPQFKPYVYAFLVSAHQLNHVRGVNAEMLLVKKKIHLKKFPFSYKNFKYSMKIVGDIFLPSFSKYEFQIPHGESIRCRIGQRTIVFGKQYQFACGFYSFEMDYHPLQFENKNFLNLKMKISNGPWSLVPNWMFTTLQLNHGLEGTYFDNLQEYKNRVLVKWDPILDFTNGNDLDWASIPELIYWNGFLNIKKQGLYAFDISTSCQTEMVLDNRIILKSPDDISKPIYLTQGLHSIKIYYQNTNNWWITFAVRWKKPSSYRFHVIPNTAWGITQ